MPRLSGRKIRVGLGSLWLLDAVLQAQPHFFSYDWWHNDLAESVMGQPAPISRSILWATHHLAAHAGIANGMAIVVQASIGLCLLVGRFERGAIAASIVWSLAVWWIGEGFGALPTGFALLPAGAPGPVLFYPLIGLLCWPRTRRDTSKGAYPVSANVAVGSWVTVWAGGALLGLPWRFPCAQMIQANIEQNSLGQPSWLERLSHASYTLVGSHKLLIPFLLLAVQSAVGIGAVAARTRRYALTVGAALALLFWITVQDVGGLAAGSTTDPGSGPLLLLLAVTVASATPGSKLRSCGAVPRSPATPLNVSFATPLWVSDRVLATNTGHDVRHSRPQEAHSRLRWVKERGTIAVSASPLVPMQVRLTQRGSP